MKTLDLNEAAAFLHVHPVTLKEKARAGEIPGAKPGKCWVFLDDDLADWLRSQYPAARTQEGGVRRGAHMAAPAGASARNAEKKLRRILAIKPPHRKPPP
jgi:excisionase family DNA binding protein